MNNLHRELAPISSAAWSQIEDEVARTFKRLVAGRRVIDVTGPAGPDLAAVGTGHQNGIEAMFDGVEARRREAIPLVELRVPFALSRHAIDDVERGADDSDWQPAKDAAMRLAFAEDRAIFDGYRAAQIKGIREGSSNPMLALPAEATDYPAVIARALEELRLQGVDGPYVVLLGSDAYTALSEATDRGYPVLERMRRLVNGELIWAPAVVGGCVLSTRGGDFEMHLGQDVSIGYLSHDQHHVHLYLQESFTFLLLASEAAVAIKPE